jgi:hypothetical protein
MYGLPEGVLVGKEHYPEMIRFRPIETGSLHKKDLFFQQQIEDELLVVLDVESLYVDFGEKVEGSLRLRGGDSRDVVQQFIAQIPLFP